MDSVGTELTKEEAKTQFDYWTKKLNLKHTFSFDEAWDFAMEKRRALRKKTKFRENIMKIETRIAQSERSLAGDKMEAANPLKHSFADGCYVREIFNPKDEFIVTKIHKVSHPFFLLKGDMSILTEDGIRRIKAPYHGITPAGTKRVIYTHEECVFVTVHVTEETDLLKIEDAVIAKNFNEVPLTQEELLNLKEVEA